MKTICPPHTINCYDCPRTECPEYVKAFQRCVFCHKPTDIIIKWNETRNRPLCDSHYTKFLKGIYSWSGLHNPTKGKDMRAKL